MSLLNFGSISSSVNKGDHWILTDASTGAYGRSSTVVDGSGNIYMQRDNSLLKFDTDGNLVWKKDLNTALGLGIQLLNIQIASNGDIIAGGILDSFNDLGVAARIDTATGNSVWYKQFDIGISNESFRSHVVESASGSYVYYLTTRIVDTGDYNTAPRIPTVIKLNMSNGSTVWSRELAEPNGYRMYTNYGVSAGSDDLYMVGYYRFGDPTSANIGYLIKVNSSGTLQWQKKFERTDSGQYTTYLELDSVGIDGSGNVVVSGNYRYNTSPVFGTALYYTIVNTGGTQTYQTGIMADPIPTVNYPTYIPGADMQTDASGNAYIYFTGYLDSGESNQYTGYLIKINGQSIEFCKNIYAGVALNNTYTQIYQPGFYNNNIYFGIGGFLGGTPEVSMFKTPDDGTKDGRYISNIHVMSYQEYPLTTYTPPVTMSSGSLVWRSLTETLTVSDLGPSVSTDSATSDIKIRRF